MVCSNVSNNNKTIGAAKQVATVRAPANTPSPLQDSQQAPKQKDQISTDPYKTSSQKPISPHENSTAAAISSQQVQLGIRPSPSKNAHEDPLNRTKKNEIPPSLNPIRANALCEAQTIQTKLPKKKQPSSEKTFPSANTAPDSSRPQQAKLNQISLIF